MTIKSLFYSKTFPHPANGQWEKISLEAEITPDEDVRQSLYALKKEVENFHYESTKHDEKIASNITDKGVVLDEPKMSAEAKMISDILSCETLEGAKGLESFKFLAEKQKEKYPDIWAAYEMMEKKLKPKVNEY